MVYICNFLNFTAFTCNFIASINCRRVEALNEKQSTELTSGAKLVQHPKVDPMFAGMSEVDTALAIRLEKLKENSGKIENVYMSRNLLFLLLYL